MQRTAAPLPTLEVRGGGDVKLDLFRDEKEGLTTDLVTYFLQVNVFVNG